MTPIKVMHNLAKLVAQSKQSQDTNPLDLRNNPPGAALAQKIHDLTLANRTGNLAQRLNPRDISSWRTGYAGEVITGELLNTLKPRGYTILHAVPLGKRGADIDHLVITPTGYIYNINTKHHPGKTVTIDGPSCRVGGQPQHHLTQAHDETVKLQDKLKPLRIPRKHITPLIVIVGSANLHITGKPAIQVLADTDLLTHIQHDERRRILLGMPPMPCPPKLYDHAFWQPDGKHIADPAHTQHLDTQAVLQDLAKLAALAAPVIIGAIKRRQQDKTKGH